MPARASFWAQIVLGLLISAATATSFKRGAAIGDDHPSARNISALADCVSWGYNWGSSYSAHQASAWDNMEYIPMVWNDRHFADNGSWIGPATAKFNHSQALLGYNEPNFREQSNMTPEQASAAWRSVESLATENHIPIVVSPAMNFNDNHDPIAWLDEFFLRCRGCRVDAIAVHSYTCYWDYLAHHLSLYKKYDKPLWLTEFACADSPERKGEVGQMEYMREVIPHLESDPQVYRYAWFSHDFELGPPGENAASLVRDGGLTPLGQLYGSFAGSALPSPWVAPLDCHASEWVDRDSPSEACTTTSLGDGDTYKLVFSDEFEQEGRTFRDGDDPRWTAMHMHPYTTRQINFYNDSLAETVDGKLRIRTTAQDVRSQYYAPDGERKHFTRPYSSAGVNSWNKVCYTEGILEVSAQLPGNPDQPGLWPAIWSMGNLGRAAFQKSNFKMWPYSSPQTCYVNASDRTANSQDNLRQDACAGRRARGAPEIDVLEAAPGPNLLPGWQLCVNSSDPDLCLTEYSTCKNEYAESIRKGACPPGSGDRAKGGDVDGMYACKPLVAQSYMMSPGFPKWSYEEPTAGCYPLGDQWYPEMTTASPDVYGPDTVQGNGFYGLEISRNTFDTSGGSKEDRPEHSEKLADVVGYSSEEMSEAEENFWTEYLPMLSRETSAILQNRKVPELWDHFAVRWSGWFQAEVAGVYHFSAVADDGLQLKIAESDVLHTTHDPQVYSVGLQKRQGVVASGVGEITLSEGWHRLLLEYYDNYETAFLELQYKVPGQGEELSTISQNLLCRSAPVDNVCEAPGLLGEYYFYATAPPVPLLHVLPDVSTREPDFTRVDFTHNNLRHVFFSDNTPSTGSVRYRDSWKQSTDGLTAYTNMTTRQWQRQTLYRMEWKQGPEGYIIWAIDGVKRFQINASALHVDRPLHYKTQPHGSTIPGKGQPTGGTFNGPVIPYEPM
eukprot:COSAG02_NODE_871_length_16337_cov_7.124276_8_plen_952_part_00